MIEWLNCVRRALRGRCVRLLEDEVTRQRAEIVGLRLENRALLNSLLGTAGIPPILVGNAEPRQTTITPVRRLSWPQITATREIEAGRQAHARERAQAKL